MESRITTLTKHSDALFEKRQPIMSIWQEMADNLYPQRADFIVERSIGRDFASYLSTSYPIMVRDQLGNAFSTMLRPSDQPWFECEVMRMDRVDNAGRRWLESATKTMRNAFGDRKSRFQTATKQGDHDFATFGQCVISVEVNRLGDVPRMLYRCWHLRDVAWGETFDGEVMPVYRKWKDTVSVFNRVFKGKISEVAKKQLKDNPFSEMKVRHAIVMADDYDTGPEGKKWKTKYVSIFWEEVTGHILEEVGTHNRMYVVPRWQTVSGSQYAYSPATVAALPDARLLQAMTLVLLEAGEKATNPPLVATQEVIRSDVQMFAGGITWIDAEYDQRTGEALKPLNLDYRGIPVGKEMREDIRHTLADAFYLNKITLPQFGGEMTAYETGQRVQEYIRNALPLFEPMETDYNGALCDLSFDLLMREGAFGPWDNIPQSIRGQEPDFKFESPLHKAIEKQKAPLFQEVRTVIAEAIALDPDSANIIDVVAATRDVLDGIGTPAGWVRSPEASQQITNQVHQQRETQNMLNMINQGAETAQKVGDAGASLQPIAGSATSANNQT